MLMSLNRKCKSQRGMALLSTMLVLMGVMTVMLLGAIGTSSQTRGNSGVMTASTNAIALSNARQQSVTAFNMAESGVEYTLQWLNSLPSPPSYTSAFPPGFKWNATTLASGARSVVVPDPNNSGNSFSVVIYPDAANAGNSQKKYLIESVGTSGKFSQIVQDYVQVTSLSKWLILVDKWPANNWWVSGITTFDGPVHDNNSDGRNEDVYWKTTATSPMWTYTGTDAYEVSGSGVNWWKDNWYSAGAPQSASDWSKIMAGGQSTLHTGAAQVPFPTNSQLQKDAALNGTAAPDNSSPVGVTAPAGGGLYIHGDAQQMTLSVDRNGNQVIDVQQTDPTTNPPNLPVETTITLDIANNQTQVHTVSQSGNNGHGNGHGHTVTTDTTTTGVTNGVVYSDGNIGNQGDPKTGGLSGVVADNIYNSNGGLTHLSNLTIATDASKNCNIDGSLTYNTARQTDRNGNYLPESQDSNFVKYGGTLGVVSNNILITTTDANGDDVNNVEVDGTILAYNLYDVDHWWNRRAGTWENMGGYLSKNMGVFNVGDANGNIIHGLNSNFNYDARMADTPPPFFPTSGSIYDVVSWRRVTRTLQ